MRLSMSHLTSYLCKLGYQSNNSVSAYGTSWLFKYLEFSFGIKEGGLFWMKQYVCIRFLCVSVNGRTPKYASYDLRFISWTLNQ